MGVVGEMDWLELKKRLNEDNLVALEFWNASRSMKALTAVSDFIIIVFP